MVCVRDSWLASISELLCGICYDIEVLLLRVAMLVAFGKNKVVTAWDGR